MTLEDFSFIGDGFKTCLSPYTLIIIPLIVLLVPNSYVLASCTFPAFRIQQYDLNGVSYGSQSVAVGLEAKTLMSNNWVRKCVIIKLGEINGHLNNILSKAAALVIIMPGDSSIYSEMERETLYDLEQRLTSTDVAIPVYVVKERDDYTTESFDQIMDTLGGKSTQAKELRGDTALNEMIKAATANTYFASYKSLEPKASATYSKALENFELLNIQTKMNGLHEEELPNILIVTYYDTFGLAPGLAFGCDSNGSGLAAFFELARILKLIYTKRHMLPKFNLIFLLSSGGKFNYLGSKKFINDQFENSDSNIMSDVSFVLCLDAIGNGPNLYLHVSKPPKENTSIHKFLGHLTASAESLRGQGASSQITLLHKKINLAEETRAWEHERYSLRKVPAFTMSHFRDYFDPNRSTMLDTNCTGLLPQLVSNVEVIAEALVRFLYFPDEDPTYLSHEILENGSILSEPYLVNVAHLRGMMQTFSHYARAQQLYRKESHILSTIVTHFSDLVKDIRIQPFRTDRREPDFTFYDNFKGELTFYRSKPALFDLYLAVLVGMYLGILHLFLLQFPTICALWVNCLRSSNGGNSNTRHGTHQHNHQPTVYSSIPNSSSSSTLGPDNDHVLGSIKSKLKTYSNGQPTTSKNGFCRSLLSGFHFKKS